jgi:hypothetical protein
MNQQQRKNKTWVKLRNASISMHFQVSLQVWVFPDVEAKNKVQCVRAQCVSKPFDNLTKLHMHEGMKVSFVSFFVQVQSIMCEVLICGGLEFSCASFICELLVHAVSMGIEKQ